MEYAVLKEDGSFDYQVGTYKDVVWGPDHKCPARSLTELERELFRVVELYEVLPPDIDPRTQKFQRDGAEFVEGKWLMKWRLDTLSESEIIEKSLKVQASIISAVQARLDSFAQTKFYDGILSACTYATSSVPKFMLEGQYAVSARDATWSAANTILEAVIAGTRPVPSGYAEIEPELPVLSWPEVP